MMGDKITTVADTGKKQVQLSAIAVMVMTLLVFLPALFGDFVNYDDNRFVVDNPGIRTFDWAMIVAALTRQFSNDYWTPLTWISFALDYRLWGMNPFGYHLVKVLLHGFNAGLVVLVADRLLRHCGWVSAFAEGKVTGGQGLPYPLILVLIGLFWSIHPLRVESVAWIAERKDVLYGMFSLGALYAYLRYLVLCQDETARGGKGYYCLSLLLFALALMAKPTSVIVPMLLAVADWYPFDRLHRGEVARVLGEKVPYVVLAAVATAMTITTMTITSPMYSYSQFLLGQRILVAGHAIFDFCRLLIIPVNIHLFNSIAPVLANPLLAIAKTGAVIAVTALFFYLGRRRKWLPAAWLSFLLPLIPTLPFFQVGVDVAYSSRHSYLAMVVPSMVLVCLFAAGYVRFRAVVPRYLLKFTIAVVLCVNVGITEQLIATWKNSGTLWTRVIQVQPIGRAFSYRAFFYLETGENLAAAADFMEAGRRAEEAGNPAYFTFYALSGDAYSRAGSYEAAVAAFTTAISRQPLPNFFYHRGLALRALGREREAAADFSAAGEETGEIDSQNLW
jgi:hypothetical protein